MLNNLPRDILRVVLNYLIYDCHNFIHLRLTSKQICSAVSSCNYVEIHRNFVMQERKKILTIETSRIPFGETFSHPGSQMYFATGLCEVDSVQAGPFHQEFDINLVLSDRLIEDINKVYEKVCSLHYPDRKASVWRPSFRGGRHVLPVRVDTWNLTVEEPGFTKFDALKRFLNSIGDNYVSLICKTYIPTKRFSSARQISLVATSIKVHSGDQDVSNCLKSKCIIKKFID
jgi:hypothetical protein